MADVTSSVLAPGRFQNWHQWKQVIHGHETLALLGDELDRLGATRVVIVTTPSVANSDVLGTVEAAVGARVAAVYSGCRRGTPRPTVLDAAAVAHEAHADALVSVGGGSVVDTAKGVALCRSVGITTVAGFDAYRVGVQAAGFESPQLRQPPLALVALPTTLSGAEYTGMIAITDPATDYRDPYRFDELAPVTILLDPALTRATPDRLWAGTGIKSLSDAFEQFVAGAAGPALEPMLLRSVAWLSEWLAPSLSGDLDARLRCQVASWLTMFGTFNAASRVGIGAAMRHQIGMVHGIPHGEATCPVLVEVARRTTPEGRAGAAVLAATEQLAPQSAGSVGDTVAERFGTLVASVGMPTKLSGFGLNGDDVRALAARVANDFANKQRTTKVWTEAEILELLEAARVITQVLDTAIAADTMGGLLDWRLRESPHLAFARCGDHRVTYREIDALAGQVQRAFTAQGLEPGARVATLAHNSIGHLAVMFACARAGVLWCPMNVSLGSDDLAYTVGDVDPALVIADAVLVGPLADAIKAPVVVIGDAGAVASIEQWTAAAANEAPLRADTVRAGDAFCVMYSGGTTGRPKGVILPHFAAVSCGYRFAHVAQWEAGEVFYSTSHLFHAYLPCAIVPFCMAHGFELCFDDWFSASRFFDRVRECGATIIDPFIGMAGALLAQPERSDDRNHPARIAVSGFGGADPNAVSIRRRFEQRFGVATYQPYGQTEAGGFISVETTHDPQRFGSSGKLTGWYDAIIVDDDGMAMNAGSEGELWVRPRFPHVMAHGYLNRADETLVNWRNLWVHTGDRCSIDADDYLWFVGRGGHFLRRRGELVSIGEVEMVLGDHPSVVEVAVVAIPSPLGEDDARGAVVLAPDATLTAPELVDWALERLAPFKVPRYIEFVTELPRTATKSEIDRPALARAGTAACYDREARP